MITEKKITTVEQLDELVNLSIVERIHGTDCKNNLIGRLPITYKSLALKRGEMKFSVDGIDYQIEKSIIDDYAGWKKIKKTVWSTDFKRISQTETKSDLIDLVNSYLMNESLFNDEYKAKIKQ